MADVPRDPFELMVEEEFAALPDPFRLAMENVHVVVEDVPGEHRRRDRSAAVFCSACTRGSR